MLKSQTNCRKNKYMENLIFVFKIDRFLIHYFRQVQVAMQQVSLWDFCNVYEMDIVVFVDQI